MQVAINSVGHRFPGEPWLFKGLSILLEPGEVYALVDPSGSGKSTLLSLIAGWVDPAEGTIERRGEGRTVWVFQNPYGSPHRTVLDHVVFPPCSLRVPHGKGLSSKHSGSSRHSVSMRWRTTSARPCLGARRSDSCSPERPPPAPLFSSSTNQPHNSTYTHAKTLTTRSPPSSTRRPSS